MFIATAGETIAATRYVDGTLGGNCSGDYSIAARACSGSDGYAYTTIAEGIAAASSGDTIYIRAGTYTEKNISINFSGSTTTIQAYNSESVTIDNDDVPETISDGVATFPLNSACANLVIDGINFTGRNSGSDEDYNAIAIGSASGGTGLITIRNCTFSAFRHCGIKGGFRYHIYNCIFSNIGQDGNDHHIYATGSHSSGSEAIIEYNHFGIVPGYPIHLYSDPKYYIVRYNIIDGNSISYGGILLSGSNHKIYNNTIFNCGRGILLFRSECHDNEVKNNLIDNNSYDLSVDTAGGSNLCPTYNTVSSNFLGSSNKCEGCTDKTSVCGAGADFSVYDDVPPNVSSASNQFVDSTPTNWYDFRLDSASVAINAGTDLGSSHASGILPTDTTWPPSTGSQSSYGAGWEIGAFLYSEPTSLTIPGGVTISGGTVR
jgi:parallel beta-helix repeat protein